MWKDFTRHSRCEKSCNFVDLTIESSTYPFNIHHWVLKRESENPLQHVEHEIDWGFTHWCRPLEFCHEITQFYARLDFKPTWSSSNQLNLCVFNAISSPFFEFLIFFTFLVTLETFFSFPSSRQIFQLNFFALSLSASIVHRCEFAMKATLLLNILLNVSRKFCFHAKKNKKIEFLSLLAPIRLSEFFILLFLRWFVCVDCRWAHCVVCYSNVFVSNLKYMWRDLWQLLCVYHFRCRNNKLFLCIVEKYTEGGRRRRKWGRRFYFWIFAVI